MKILELRFKNLNSLYGEWFLDFTEPEYSANGIFALTGPTGSGKTTILDAICLALYGATPRLGKITKSGNEIMSRQTGECYAEVIFESQTGRFLCHWEHRRARKKAGGALQIPEHQIAVAQTGKLIETKKSLVPAVIEEKTGMDFERFTRSILLAQGGFDTFLKADAEQKSRILEQITGTEIYSEISRRVHERRREELEKLNMLTAETFGIEILESEQEKEIQLELEGKQKAEKDVTTQLAETGKAITWLNTIDGLQKEISSLRKEEAKLKNDQETFTPNREKLAWSVKAAAMDGAYATLVAIRKQQLDDQAALITVEENLPELEASAKKHADSLTSAEQQTIHKKNELKATAPLILKVRALDQRLAAQEKTISEVDENCKKDTSIIISANTTRGKELKKLTDARKNLELAEGYLKEHSQDEWLVSGLAGVEEQLANLQLKHKEYVQKGADQKQAQANLKKVLKTLQGLASQRDTRKQEREEEAINLKRGRNTLRELLAGRLIREYRAEKETLFREMAFLARIADLENYRLKLEDGTPCPLCGAREHPFAEGNIPESDKTEKKIEVLTKLISRAENQEAAIKILEEAENKANRNLIDSEKLEAAAVSEQKIAEKALSQLEDNVAKIRSDFTKSKEAILAKIQPLGITDIAEFDVLSLVESLRERLRVWLAQVKKKTDIEKHIADLESEVKRLDAVIKTQGNGLREKQQRLEALNKEYVKGGRERNSLYGNKRTDDEELRLNQAISDAEQAEKQARAINSKVQKKLTTAKTNVESLKKRIGKGNTELKKSESDFIAGLKPTGFSDEEQFLKARLSAKEQGALSARAKVLDDGQTDLEARQKDRKTRLSAEISKKITEKTPEELKLECKEFEYALKQHRTIIASLKHRLSENSTAKEKIKKRLAAIDAQKKESLRWEKLHGLIGSADGKKYRNFAQGLTFELMVSHANRQLEKMTARYLLIRDETHPLELNVVDNYQAGEIRSTKNLSGGESFIVSLTLALGLSKMASRKVRVDSLFLDEGFGTLDEEALETALDALASLQQDGKLIGIISHVSAMKERISTQVNITPGSGGKSTLTGPGCSKIVNAN